MKIKTKLYISLYLSVCTMLVVMMALYWSYRKHNKADENEGLVVEIQKAIFERTILRDEYILYQEERAKSEWQKKSEYAGRLMDLASKRFKDDMSKAILDEMHRNYDNTVAIFSKIVENRERKDLNDKEKALSSEYEDRLISQILLKAYALSNAAQELRESNSRRSKIALKRMNLLIVIFVVAVMIVAFANLVWLNRLLGKRLETIRKGTKIIGDGNLDYRIDLRSKDEFEDLSNEFNAMGDKLKKSFVSVENLEKEIIERKLAGEALRESEKRFKLAAECSTDLIYEWDLKERVDWFGKIDELLGYSPSEFPRTIEAWANSVHPEDRDRVVAAVKNHLEKNEPYNIEYRVRKKDGTYNYWWGRGNAARDEKGNPYRWVGAITDVTERKKAEEALKASEEKYRSLVQNIPDVVWTTDINGKTIFISPNVKEIYGYTSEEIYKGGDSAWFDRIHPDDVEKVKGAFISLFEKGELFDAEYRIQRKDKDWIWLHDRATNVYEKNGIKCADGVFSDITEHKRAEEEREKLIHELQDALGKIQTLSGLLPICAWCKKIRDDEGYWNQLETYIGDHSEAEFTHSICPECMKKHDPDFADNKNKEVIKENIK